MNIKEKKVKSDILETGRKIGVTVVQGSDADRALTKGTTAAANLVNETQKQAKRVARELDSTIDRIRASVHAATAPRPTRRQTRTK